MAASGNGGCTNGIVLPACVSNALAVGAVYDAAVGTIFFGRGQCLPSGCSDANPAADQIACYSDSSDRLDVLAPSHCARAPRRGGRVHLCFGGTSGAAPYAAGVAALLFGAEPLRGPAEVKAAMRSTGTPITDARNGITRNRLDAPAALASLRGAPQGSARAELLVPVVLDVTGVGGARFVSELTLTNRGTTAARLEATYTAATGMFPSAGGSGTVVDSLARASSESFPTRSPGSGRPRGSRSRRGPARPAPFASSSPGCRSRAGLGPRADDRRVLQRLGGALVSRLDDGGDLATSLQLFGLRSGAFERTNLAVVNAGTEGSVTLRIVLRSGDGASVYEVPSALLPPLAPGEWRQVNDADLLRAAGFSDATALVSRLAGRRRSAPTPSSTTTSRTTGRTSRQSRAVGGEDARLPVVVETSAFESELVLHNPGVGPSSSRSPTSSRSRLRRARSGRSTVELGPDQQRILPRVLDTLRTLGLPLGPRGAASYAGTLSVVFSPPPARPSRASPARRRPRRDRGVRGEGELRPLLHGVPGLGRRGRRGLRRRPPADRDDPLEPRPLQPVVPERRDGPVRGRDGATGVTRQVGSVELSPLGWTQVDRVLLGAAVTEGYVGIRRTSAGGASRPTASSTTVPRRERGRATGAT